MAPNVFRELLDRNVPALRLLAQGHQHDVVHVSGQASPQFLRAAFPWAAHDQAGDGAGVAECSAPVNLGSLRIKERESCDRRFPYMRTRSVTSSAAMLPVFFVLM